MEAEIRVSGGDGIAIDEVGELAALLEWLRGERGLAGAIREIRRLPGPDELGGVVEALAVALGAGGAAGTLAKSLFGWLRTRRPSLKVTVTKGAHSIAIEAGQVRDGDVLPLLREVLEASDGLLPASPLPVTGGADWDFRIPGREVPPAPCGSEQP